jgi:chemotaxis methyl-accepting protein methylase
MSRVVRDHVSFEGRRTRPAARTPAGDGESRGDGEPPLSAVPAAALACRTLACSGIDPEAYRARPLVRRLPACLRALDTRSAATAERLVSVEAAARSRALNTLLISVTSFFRDDDVFAELARTVVPVLARRGPPLRVWSAGCANGSELYSMGMLLDEAGLLSASELVGTDCRPDAIAQAREAAFDAPALESVAAPRRARFFERAAHGTWRVAGALRARTTWRVRNVLNETEPGPWDVIFWRNVAIYLRFEAALGTGRRLVGQLAPGGFLVVGKAERLPTEDGLSRVARCVYRREGAPP